MKLTNSLVAIAALSTLSFAGGDINPVTVFEQEPVVVPVEPVVVPKPAPAPIPAPVVVAPAAKDFYLGLGATRVKVEADRKVVGATEYLSHKEYQTGVTGRLGYDFMNFLGAELRGTSGLRGDSGYTKFKQYGAYLKPNVDLTDSLNLYGLVGASKANLADSVDINKKETGLSYGLGLDYSVSDSVSVFVDVVDYLRKSNKNDLFGATLGAAYHF